jgi:ribosomal peptide maturation radical SAM protein 1
VEGRTDVALINMPFGSLLMPSIGLGLLKAAMSRIGVPAKTFYFSIRYAELIGEPLYRIISDETHTHDLVGEWIFSSSLFESQSELDVEQYIEDILHRRGQGRSNVCNYKAPLSAEAISQIVEARNKAEMFLEECLNLVIECKPKIVGFTSVFLQQLASLSLAKRIKAKSPETLVVFGGANCEGAMGSEIMRQFDFVDVVVSGEGDLVFPELVQRVLNNQRFTDLQGVYCRPRASLRLLNEPLKNTPAIENMDALPMPDYDEYFEQLNESSLKLSDEASLLFETSRGCWWGAKHHCTFCGLNGETMAHRSKSAGRSMDELSYLISKYPGYPVRVTDNILDMSYFRDFIPALAERKLGTELFYEVKANLKKEQVRQLRDAGITTIQPGIESLSDSVLQLMRKGVRALQNIQLLKWCKELEVVPDWNFLWGFPGESPEEYLRMAEFVSLLTHLPPPNFALTMRLDRFSPNFDQSEQLGLKNVLPFPAYNHVYRLPPDAVANLAYFFTFEYAAPQDVDTYTRPLATEIGKWQNCYSTSALFSVEKDDRLLIWDSRPIATEPLIVLAGHQKFIYMACDQIRTPGQILNLCTTHLNKPIDIAEISRSLETLTAQRIMIRQDESYLALAVPRSL